MEKDHIAEEVLERYVKVQTSRVESEAIQSHLGQCDTCQQIYEELEACEGKNSGRLGVEAPDSSKFSLSPGDLYAGRYHLLRKLDSGGFATVWEALDEGAAKEAPGYSSNRIALKIAPVGRIGADEEFRLAVQFDHPNVVSVLRRGGDEATQSRFLAFSLVEGKSLAHYIKDGGIHWRQVLKWMKRIASGVEHVHQQGLYHLDLKPENIMLEARSGQPVLIDFGVSAHRDSVSSNAGAGTWQYMSPEHVEQKATVGARSDIWSVGVIMYELLTGNRPFESETAILEGTPRPIRETHGEVPEKVVEVCTKCLQKEPRDRYQTATDLHKAISRLQRPETIRRTILAGAVVIAIVTSLGTGVGYWMWFRPPTWRVVDQLPAIIADREWIRLRVSQGQPISVASTCRVEPGGRLSIEGQGVLQFAKDAGIHSRGKLELSGAGKNQPLILRRLDAKQAWSGIQVIGEGSRGSRFSNLRIEGGQGIPCATPHPRSGNEPKVEFPTEEQREGASRQGGGVLVAQTGDVRFENVAFVHNSARRGGAVFLYDSTTIQFESCDFVGNVARSSSQTPRDAPGGGGAVFTQLVHGVFFEGGKFEQNSATDRYSCGGALSIGYRSAVEIRGVEFIRNHAMDQGGAIYLLSLKPKSADDSDDYRSECQINLCQFRNNGCGIWIPWPKSVDAEGAFGKSANLGYGTSIYLDAGVNLTLNKSTFSHDFPYRPIIFTEGSRGNPSLLTTSDCTFRVAWESAMVGDLIQTPDKGKGGETHIPDVVPIDVLPSPIENDLIQYGFKELASPRLVDTVVVHYASALYWGEEKAKSGLDEADRNRFYERHRELEQIQGRDRIFHPKFVRAVFEAFQVAPHYLIARDGRIFRLVREKDEAHHAGVSRMPAHFDPNERTDVNEFSVGVELIATNPAADPEVGEQVGCDVTLDGNFPAYTYWQYHALRWLLANIPGQPHIRYIVGHDEIDADPKRVPGRRRQDPGPHFLWDNIRDGAGAPLR